MKLLAKGQFPPRFDSLLESVMRGAIAMIKADGASILFYDNDSQFFSSDALSISGPSQTLERYTTSARKNQGLANRILATREILVVEDAESDDRVSAIARQKKRRAFVGLPLRAFDLDLGVLYLHWETPQAISTTTRFACKTIASQAALTTFAAQRYEEVHRAHLLTQAVGSAVHALNSNKNLPDALHEVARQAHSLLREDLQAYTAVTMSLPRGVTRNHHEISGRSTEPLLMARFGPTLTPPTFPHSAPKGELSIELLTDDETEEEYVGLLTFETVSTRAFSEDERGAISFFASQVASNLRKVQQQRDIEQLGRLLIELSQTETIEPQQVRHAIARSASDFFGSSLTLLYPYDSAIHEAGKTPTTASSSSKRASTRDGAFDLPLSRHIALAASGEILILDLEPRTPEPQKPMEAERATLAAAGYRQLQALPLVLGEEVIGVLILLFSTKQTVSRFEEELFRQYCHHSAHLLKRSTLMRDLRATKETAEKVAGIQNLEELQPALDKIIRVAKDVLNADIVTLYRFDFDKEKLETPPLSLGVRDPRSLTDEAASDPGSILNEILPRKTVTVVDAVPEDTLFSRSKFAVLEEVQSCACLPLRIMDRTFGLMFVSYRRHRVFKREDLELLLWFAVQAGIALRNAELYQRSQDINRTLTALLVAGQKVSKGLNVKRLLQAILKQSIDLLPPSTRMRCIAYVALLKDQNSFEIIAVHPEKEFTKIDEAIGVIDLARTDRPIGVLGRCIVDEEVQNIADVRNHPDYIPAIPQSRSQLAIPLIVDREVLGAIGIEDTAIGSFRRTYEDSIRLFSSQAAMALANAKRFEDLERIKGRIGSKTALAWMGMASSTLLHRIQGNAATIRDLSQHISNYLLRHRNELVAGYLGEAIAQITQIAQSMLEQPTVPPLEKEDGSELVDPEVFLTSRIKQLEERGAYRNVSFHLSVGDLAGYRIRINRLWLRQALDILFENSRVAFSKAGITTGRIEISTSLDGDQVHIRIGDNGPGIDSSVEPLLFQAPVPKGSHEPGMGMGLLLAELIAETYDGVLVLDRSSPYGTLFRLSFPKQTL